MPVEDGAAGTATQGTEQGGSADGAAAKAATSDEKDPRLAQARSEAIDERKARQAAEAELKKLKDAQLSEDEKKTARLAELEAEHTTKDGEIQHLRSDNALAFAAVELGARHPKEVAKLIAFSDVKFDDAGLPTNATDLVEKLKKRMPELFGGTTGSADGGARNGPAGGAPSMNDLLRQKAGRG